jgi:hypothetical protein
MEIVEPGVFYSGFNLFIFQKANILVKPMRHYTSEVLMNIVLIFDLEIKTNQDLKGKHRVTPLAHIPWSLFLCHLHEVFLFSKFFFFWGGGQCQKEDTQMSQVSFFPEPQKEIFRQVLLGNGIHC